MTDVAFGLKDLAIAVVSGGLLQFLLGWVKDSKVKRAARPSQIDASIVSVSKARDQLERDNALLRQDRAEIARQHALDRAEWEREKDILLQREAGMRTEIDALEAKVRSLWQEISALKMRHGDR